MATPEQKKMLQDALASRGLAAPSVTDQEAADQAAHLAALHQQDLEAASIGAMPDAAPVVATAKPIVPSAAPADKTKEELEADLRASGALPGHAAHKIPGGPGIPGGGMSTPAETSNAPAAPSADGAVFASSSKPPPQVVDFPNFAQGGGASGTTFVQTHSPQVQAEFQNAYAAKRAANLADFNVAQQNYDTMGQLYKNHQLQSRVQGAIDKGEEDRLRGQIEADRMAADNVAEQNRKLAIDPNHFWHEKTLGQKALLVLGQGLSDAGAALLGHPELIGKQVNAMIDRDLEAQRMNIEKSGHNLADVRGALAERYRQLGDMRAAHAAARQDMANELGMQLQEAAQKTGSQTAIARAQQVNADLLLQQADTDAKGEKLVNTGAGAGAFPKQQKAQMELFDSFMKGAVPETSLISLPGGATYAIPDDPSGQRTKAAQKMVAGYQDFVNLAQQAKQIRAKVLADPSRAPTYNAMLKQIGAKMIVAQTAMASEEGGSKVRLSGPEIEFAQNLAADPASMAPWTDQVLDNAQAQLHNDIQSAVQTLHARPVQTRMIRNPWGQVVPYTTYGVANPTSPDEDVPMSAPAGKGYNIKPPTVK